MEMEIEHSEVAGNGRSVSVTSVQDELKTEWKKSLKAICLASGSSECLGLVLQYRRNTTTLRENSDVIIDFGVL